MHKAISPNSVLGNRYEIIHEIARGGMGIVYKAFDQQLEMPVAIKVLTANLLNKPEALDDLKREAKASMMLSHPNVVRLHNFDAIGDINFLIMEYLSGPNLALLLSQEKRFSQEKTIAFATQICAGLDYAHRQKVVHRDIKPSNIMIAQDQSIKIADFGIASIAYDALAKVTQDNTVAGTLAYMAPERLQGEFNDYRSDLYSVGIMLYEFISGKPPFHTGAIEFQIMHSTPQPLLGISDDLAIIINKALAKDPHLRWQSAAEMYHALNRRKASETLPPDIPADRRRVPRAVEKKPAHQRRAAEQRATPAATSSKIPWVILGIIICGLAAAGWFLVLQKQPLPPPALLKEKATIDTALIKKWQIKADVLVVQRRLVSPKGNNALQLYRKILSEDPNNFYAQQKINWIIEKELDWAKRALLAEQYARSHTFYQNVLEADPGNKTATIGLKKTKIFLEEAQKQLAASPPVKQQKKTVAKKTSSTPAPAKTKKETPPPIQQKTPPVQEQMTLIPAGSFTMGTTQKNITTYAQQFPDESGQAKWRKRTFSDEQHKGKALTVTLSAFFIDKHEVTNKEYQEFVMANPLWQKYNISPRYHDGNYLKHWNQNQYPVDKADHPVVYVSWYSAKAYAAWREKRLPTEAEWEKAARGKQDFLWPWGNTWKKAYLNARDSKFQGTVPVASFPQGVSSYQIHDLAGNVWEWCADWYRKDYYKSAPSTNPKGPLKAKTKVLKGGSWGSSRSNTRIPNRYNVPPNFCGYSIGFRCVKNQK